MSTAQAIAALREATEDYRAVIVGNHPGQDLYCELVLAGAALNTAGTAEEWQAAQGRVRAVADQVQAHAQQLGLMLPPRTRIALEGAVSGVRQACRRVTCT